MLLKRGQLPIFIVNLIYLLFFGVFYWSKRNYEFIGYVGTIVFFFAIVLLTNKKVNYPNFVLWGLTLWGILHMLGGSVKINGGVLYKFILVNISESYEIFKYDQFVHIIGFGVATLLMYILIRPHLKNNLNKFVALSIVIVMAGLGVGALNEIVEFTATVFVSETGVGGYTNTSLDLVADLIGGLIALIYLRFKDWKI